MNIDDITIGEARQLSSLFSKALPATSNSPTFSMIGKKVIIRTFSAGVHYGELVEKDGKEVILGNARRLWYWKTANKGISLSEVANEGLAKDSKVCAPVDAIWLEAVEIIPCTKEAIKNIEAQDVYKA
jgi:hypothetical protein